MAVRSINATLRQTWMNIHLWIGVGLLLVMVPLSFSGAVLVWHEPMERALNAVRFDAADREASLPPSAYLAAAATAFGDRAVLASVRFPEDPGLPVTVIGQMTQAPLVQGRPQQLTAWLDPATAQVRDVANIRNSFFSVMHRLHGNLLMSNAGGGPFTGRKIVGWLGWGMAASCATGLWLWWPRGGNPLKGFRWKRTPKTFDNLHHLLGFWVLIPLLVLSLTGIYIAFPTTSRGVLGIDQPAGGAVAKGGAPGRGGAAAVTVPLAAPTQSADAALAAASAMTPGGRPVQITLPTDGREPVWRIQLKSGDKPPVTIAVLDADGVARADRGGGGGGGGGGRTQDPFSRLVRNIHYGTDTGLIWQILIFAGGAIPPVLSITGLVMWLRRERRLWALRRLKANTAA